MLQQAISGLAGAVELLRDTVHNLKPAEEPGLAYFEAIIENFRFCPVDFAERRFHGTDSPSG